MSAPEIGGLGDGNLHRIDEEYVQHKKKVYNYAFARTQNPDIAEEVVQEVFKDITGHEGRHGAETKIEDFERYVMGTAHNVLADRMRREVRERRFNAGSLDDERNIALRNQAVDEWSAKANIKRIETEEIIQKCMTDATEREKQMFDLLFYEDWSIGQIAEHLHISVATAKVEIARLKGRLRYRVSHQ